MNEKLMAEDVLRPYGITLYYKGCEYLRDAIVLHWHRPDLKPCQLLQLVADSSVAWKVNGIGGEKPMSIMKFVCRILEEADRNRE